MNCTLRSALHSECTFYCQNLCDSLWNNVTVKKPSDFPLRLSVSSCLILTWNIFPPNQCVWQYVCACNFLLFPLFCVCDGNFACFLKSLHSIVWACLGFSCSFVIVCVFKYHTLEIINPQQDSKCHVGIGKDVYLTLWVEKHWDNVLSIV